MKIRVGNKLGTSLLTQQDRVGNIAGDIPFNKLTFPLLAVNSF